MAYRLRDPVTGFEGIYPTESHLSLAMCDYVKEHATVLQGELLARYSDTDWRGDEDIADMFAIEIAYDREHKALCIAAKIIADRLIHG